MAYTWKDQLKVCESIRRKCFESEEVDPSWLKKSIIQEAKERHNGDFAAVNETFLRLRLSGQLMNGAWKGTWNYRKRRT